ncbi:glycerophosphoryl diester phosphodiesterase membrane domain-containing protein [Streptomyces ovatisporus]|uniref:Glycerophosphoryl diester phosphodiesterase membrane domain-containing protein n=1 Tax=Streptomyces ovatisporus TaxID=1128682 RepID=A0ABV9AEG6_9ACTN
MNDSPGWASPGSSPSDGSPEDKPLQSPGSSPPGRPADEPPKNWSAQQPPAHGGAGWGTPPESPGWGKWDNGWNHQPPAAKPGVIPLRPLGVGEILDGAVATMRAHWRTVLGISLVVAVVVQLVGTLITGFWLRDSADLTALSKNPEPTAGQLMDAMSGTLSSSGIAVLVNTLGTVIATAMLMVVVSRAVLGRTVDAGEAWRDSRPQLLRLLGLLVLVPLLVSLSMAAGAAPGVALLAAGLDALGVAVMIVGLVAGLVGAIWIWVRFSLAAPALMLEKQGVLTAMRRSAKLVRGSWWRVFGVQILAAILVFIVASIIQMPATLIGALVSGQGAAALTDPAASTSWSSLIATGIGAVIASTITFPIRAGVTALIYLDQRIRREALDLELARAAGISGYGDQQADRPAAGG